MGSLAIFHLYFSDIFLSRKLPEIYQNHILISTLSGRVLIDGADTVLYVLVQLRREIRHLYKKRSGSDEYREKTREIVQNYATSTIQRSETLLPPPATPPF